jgi:hypothetical protein
MRSSATVPTEHGRRYMAQLVKHFAHRAPASLDAREGHIRFEAGEVRLRAADDTLMVIAEAAAPEGLDRLERVVESHLKRFAFREPQLAVEWSRPRPASGM